MPPANPSESIAIAVMAKAPQAGRAKTRLVPPLHPDQAAALGAAFLRDITENIALAAGDAPIAGYVAYAPAGAESSFDGLLADGTALVLADGSASISPLVQGIGRSLLHAARSLLAVGYAGACLVNADSPTLPTGFLIQAATALLAPGQRVVLGPAEDGGYYLIGMRSPHAHLFETIDWSTDRVVAQTCERARTLGLPLIELPTWYDVDDRDSLARLVAALQAPPSEGPLPYEAAATRACLALDLSRDAGLGREADQRAARSAAGEGLARTALTRFASRTDPGSSPGRALSREAGEVEVSAIDD